MFDKEEFCASEEVSVVARGASRPRDPGREDGGGTSGSFPSLRLVGSDARREEVASPASLGAWLPAAPHTSGAPQ